MKSKITNTERNFGYYLGTLVLLYFIGQAFLTLKSCTGALVQRTETVTIEKQKILHVCSKHKEGINEFNLLGTKATFDKDGTIYFYIGDLTGLDKVGFREAIYHGFNEWAKTGYKFKEVFSPHLAYISFTTVSGCIFSEGEGAHAHAPKTKEAGAIHINPLVDWSGNHPKFGMTHEIGHTLGLYHSNEKDAIMYPYSAIDSPIHLHYDDLQGFYSMYPKKHNKEKTNEELAYSDYSIAMWLLKSFEGLHFKPYWDVIQYTNGWGMRTNNPKETIDIHEANERTLKEYNRVYNDISIRYPNLGRWERLILSCMDYNVGNFGKRLDKAIKSGDKKSIAKMMRKYVHDSKGNKLKGLVRRRNKEVELFLSDIPKRQRIAKQLKQEVENHIAKANIEKVKKTAVTQVIVNIKNVDQESFLD